MKKTKRQKFTTTIEEDVIIKLDIIRIEKGLKGKNDVIEYLTKNYWGNNDEDNKKKSRQGKGKTVSK